MHKLKSKVRKLVDGGGEEEWDLMEEEEEKVIVIWESGVAW